VLIDISILYKKPCAAVAGSKKKEGMTKAAAVSNLCSTIAATLPGVILTKLAIQIRLFAAL
jgi:hypothetical protein